MVNSTATTATTTATPATVYLGIVELVVREEVDGVLVERDVDLADGVVGGRFRVAGGHHRLEPRLQQAEAVTPLHL